MVAPLAGGGFHGGARTGAILDFVTSAGETIVVREGVSFTGAEGARANLVAETAAPGWAFDRVRADARARWAKILGRIEVSTEDAARADTFYTGLYRTMAGKSVMNDADGRYRDFRGETQRLRAPADAVYSSDSVWGTQWDLTPLWTLAFPEVASSFANSLLELQSRGGWVPQAPTNLRYSPIMVAQHQDALLASAATKHLAGVDPERAWAAVRHDLTTPGTSLADGQYAGDRNLAAYMAHGFVPDEEGPSSNTLEYAYDDSCAAALAGATGHAADAAMFDRRAASWRAQFDAASGYPRPRRADGAWVAAFDPRRFGTVGGWNGHGFVEGTAWTYSFWVPQDVPALVALVGRDRFNARLEAGFADGSVDLTNQPGLQSPFLFNYSGKPWLTQKWARAAADAYDTDPLHGWPGEEDEGQLTAYHTLLAMGQFEMDGGCAARPAYDLASPSFRRTTIHLANGHDFIIEAEGAPANVYIQSATWNGRPLDRPVLLHESIMQGGTLRYVLGPQPNIHWGVQP